MEVTVIGSLMMDLIAYAEALPKTGETVFGKSFQQSFGGKGANQAVQCARLGVKTTMVGCVGPDSYGDEYLQQLQREGVNSDTVIRSSASRTGTAIIEVDDKGQNTIIIVQGANLELSQDHLHSIENLIADTKVVLLQNEIPIETTRKALLLCKKHGTISVLNPAPASEHLRELIPLCDIFCPNETELSALAGLPTETDEQIQAAGARLIEWGCSTLVVTLGARGACVIDKVKQFTLFPTVHQVTPVDTVGAGDSFIGTLAANIARGVPLRTAVPRAILCASLSVTKRGAQASCPTTADLQQLQLHDGTPAADFAPPPASDSAVSKPSIKATLRI